MWVQRVGVIQTAEVWQLLEELGADPPWLAATALRLSAIIPAALLEPAQQRLHAAFVAEE